MKCCFVRWKDTKGDWHETKRYDNLIVALHVMHKDAERLGLEVGKANGCIEIKEEPQGAA